MVVRVSPWSAHGCSLSNPDIILKCLDVHDTLGILRVLVLHRDTLTRVEEKVSHFLMNVDEVRRYVKNLRGENRTLKLEIREYQKENARLQEIIKTLETQAVENLKEQGFIK